MKKRILLIGAMFYSVGLFASSISQTPKENSLIVYNSNIGLFHEKRALTLKKDDTSIIYEGVASSIDTDSVNITLPKGVKLFSQQYRYDKINKNKLLDAYISKFVYLKTKTGELQKVKLLSNNTSEVVIEQHDKKISFTKSENILFDKLPKTLITKPSLVWNIQTDNSVDDFLEIEYIIKNISFKSDYILNLHKNTADLTGWITINNRCGKNFQNTQLSLLAGDINRVANRPRTYAKNRALTMMDAPAVSQRSFEGYHLYSIPFKVNLANNETTQIKFLEQNTIAIEKLYEVHMQNPLYMQAYYETNVIQYIKLSPLAEPLPKGVVRIYSKLKNQNILLGESAISHTPKNKAIKLKTGKNFDIKADAKILQRKDTKKVLKATVLYTLHNHSDEDVKVDLYIPFNKERDSKIKTAQKYRFTKGNLATFTLEIQANSSKSFKVTYESKR